MAKGPKVNDEIRDLILNLRLENPAWSAAQVRNRLLSDPPIKKNQVPGLRKIQYIIARNRPGLNKMKASALRKPWSMGALKDNDSSASFIGILLRMQKYRKEVNREPLTIRQAKWTARLYAAILQLNEGKEPQDVLNILDWWVWRYAIVEEAREITNTNTDFNTSSLDRDLIESKGDVGKVAENQWTLISKLRVTIEPVRKENSN